MNRWPSSHQTMATFFFLDNSDALRARVAFLISRSRFGPSARKTAGQASFLEGVGLRLSMPCGVQPNQSTTTPSLTKIVSTTRSALHSHRPLMINRRGATSSRGPHL